MTKMSGAKALIESLEQQNVDVIFGILGGAILPVYDALCGNAENSAHTSLGTSNARHTQPKAMLEPADE